MAEVFECNGHDREKGSHRSKDQLQQHLSGARTGHQDGRGATFKAKERNGGGGGFRDGSAVGIQRPPDSEFTFVVQNVLCEGQHGGEDAADAQPQHAGTHEEEHPAGVEDHQRELHQYGPHLRQACRRTARYSTGGRQ